MATTVNPVPSLKSINSNEEQRQPTLSNSSSISTETTTSSSIERLIPKEDHEIEDSDDAPVNILDLPENAIEHVFGYLDLIDLRSVQLTSFHFQRILNDENREIWTNLCLKKLHPDVINSPLINALTAKGKLRALEHAWNPNDCSRNIFIKENGFTFHRNPVAQSTDGVRGKIGFTRGRHAWEVIWHGPLGTVAMVGVAKNNADMRAQGYLPLLGHDDKSWGWNLVENNLLHNGDTLGNYPFNPPGYMFGDTLRVILDCEDGTLLFQNDFEFLGVAFRGLPTEEPLFPAVSVVYGNTEVSMVYLGNPMDETST